MIKLFAVASVVLSGTLFGTVLCQAEKDSLVEAEEVYRLITYIKDEIESKSTPLDKIFFDYFSEQKTNFIEKKIKGVRGSYGEKILILLSDVCTNTAQNQLKDFALTLGTLDKASQKEALKKALVCLETELIKKRTEAASKYRLYKTLSLLISCIIAVLLY